MTAHGTGGTQRTPWDTGQPQPAVRALAESGLLTGPVLDVGCGDGQHALLAAEMGLPATGIDIDPAVLHRAREQARRRGLPATFLQYDALALAALPGRLVASGSPPGTFDTAVDSLLFHALGGEARARYVAGLRRVLRPGGRLVLLCYSEHQPDVPHRTRRSDITQAFNDGWRLDAIDAVRIDTRVHPDGARGWRAVLTALPPSTTSHQAVGVALSRRADRYLNQLCDHLEHLRYVDVRTPHSGASHPSSLAARQHGGGTTPDVVVLDRTARQATMSAGGGVCVLTATDSELRLEISAESAGALDTLVGQLDRRLRTLGRRDALSPTWL